MLRNKKIKLHLKTIYLDLFKNISGLYDWIFSGGCEVAPNFIKKKILRKFGHTGADWIETGTYLGQTTKFLSKYYPNVVSIEPVLDFYQFTRDRFANRKNVKIVNGYSEDVLKSILDDQHGQLNIFLDGHYSGGLTALNNGGCPLIKELRIVHQWLQASSENDPVIFIDDWRLISKFSVKDKNVEYPDISVIFTWACDNNMALTIVSDIAVMKLKKEGSV